MKFALSCAAIITATRQYTFTQINPFTVPGSSTDLIDSKLKHIIMLDTAQYV